MTFEKGSLVMVDYTARVKDGEVFETTSREEAEGHHMHDHGARYGPRLVSIGDPSYPVLAGFDEALAAASAGEKIEAEVPPEKGFGARDPGKVRMIPLRKLGDDAEKVAVGDTIEIDDKRCTVRFIGSGRVQVDYNHRFAGKTILFDATVTRLLDSDEGKVGAIIARRLGVDESRAAFGIKDGEATVSVPAEMHRAEGLQVMKHLVQADIFKFVPSLARVVFVETYSNPRAPGDGGAPGGAEPAGRPAPMQSDAGQSWAGKPAGDAAPPAPEPGAA